MRKATSRLFDEFAASFVAGDDPDLRSFLGRAGDDAPTLARLIDVFLAGSEPPPTTAERLESMRAWVDEEPPLLKLRVRLGLTRATVVDSLLGRLGLAPSDRPRLADAYHELESGRLDPARVDGSVWSALAEILKANVRELAAWRPPPVAASVYLRADAEIQLETGAVIRQHPMTEPDEVDRLFRGTT